MRRHPIALLIRVAVLAVLAGAGAIESAARDQPAADTAPKISAKEQWSKRIYYDAPNSHQMRTELSGSEATLLENSGGKVLLKDFRIKQFPASGGDPQMIADAPECVYDNKSQQVASAGPLQVHAQDGRLFVEGTGFLLRETNSSLTISNRVRSIFQPPAANGVMPSGTEISARTGDFLMRTETSDGYAIYRGGVRVNDPKMKLACEILTADLPRESSGDTNGINHVVAETNVVIDFAGDNGEQNRATSDKAVYTKTIADHATNQIVEMTGNPRVEMTNGWMTADRLFLNHTTGKMQGRGHVHFHTFAQTAAATTNQAAQPATEIYCDLFDYDLNTRQADFFGQVRVDDEKTKVAAGFMTTILLKDANHFDHIVARTNVVIDFQSATNAQKIHATGQQAVYDCRVAGKTTNQIVALTGNPAAQSSKPDGWMTADVITVNRSLGRIWGLGNQHSVFKREPGETAAQDTEIFSERADFSTVSGQGVYQDNVREYDPEMNTTGKKLTFKIGKAGPKQANYPERVQADGNVTVDFIDKPFSDGDITNLNSFASRLKQPAASDGVARFTAAQLSAPTRKLLANYRGGTNAPLQRSLAEDLNRIVRGGGIYDAERFAGVYLSLDTTTRMSAHPLGVELTDLNRLLLLDAFRGQIARNSDGEITHATGDHAVYSQHITAAATNQVVELSGHARLDKPDRWITADDSITADRTTGIAHALGHPRLHMRMEPVAKNKAPPGTANNAAK